jgi:hypothetical protein
VQKSSSEFVYFASGRKNCVFAEFRINLIRRQCLLTHAQDLWKGKLDTLTIDIPIDTNSKFLPVEFLIIKKKDLKAKMTEHTYLGDMVYNSNTKHYRPENMASKESFMIMSEHDEVANQLIDDKVGSLLLNQKNNGFLEELHITDQKTYNHMGLMMRAVLRLPEEVGNSQVNEQFHQVLQMVIYMVDVVVGLRLSPTVTHKCEKSRKKQKALEAQTKKEEQDEKKLEAKKDLDKLEREKVLRMAPKEQAKYEDKMKKKQATRTKSKLMKVMK